MRYGVLKLSLVNALLIKQVFRISIIQSAALSQERVLSIYCSRAHVSTHIYIYNTYTRSITYYGA